MCHRPGGIDMNDNKFAFNPKHAAILALGSSAKCRIKIEEIYKSDELVYYQKYKTSQLYEDKLKEIYPAIDLEHINMLIGIFEDAYEKNDFNDIYVIVKELNPRILKFLKNKTVIDIDEFLNREFFNNKYKRKIGTGIFFDESVNEGEMYKEAYVLFYVASLNNQCIEGLYKQRVIENYSILQNSLSIHKMVNQPTENALKRLDEFKLLFGLDDVFINRQKSLGDLFDNLIEYQIEAKLCSQVGKDNFQKYGVPISLYDSIRKSIFKTGVFKYIGSYCGFTPLLNFEADLSLASVPINSEITNKIILACINSLKGNNIPETEAGLLLISELYMYAIIYHYNELKDKYLHSEKEKYFEDITNLRNSLNTQYEQLLSKQSEANDIIKRNKTELDDLKKKLAEVNSSLRTTELKLKKKDDELKRINDVNKKLYIENDMLYELLNRDSNTPTEASYTEKLSFIQSKRLALFGGNKATINLLKSQFEKIIIFEKNTSDISSIKSCDAVFVNYQWLKHSLSYKLYSLAKTEKIPFIYISGTNIEKIVNQMYDALLTTDEA